MPHIIIEHSNDFENKDIYPLLPKIQKAISSIKEGNFDLEQCKARSISFDKYYVGTISQENSSFLHVTLKILEGRSPEIREMVAKKIFTLLNNFIEQQKNHKNRIDLSVDVVEMTKGVYQKLTIAK